MTKQFKLKGINGDSETCEICGKTNLNKVMWLAELDKDGNELGHQFAAGTTCGAKMLGLSTDSKAIAEKDISELAYQMVKDEITRIFKEECVNYQLKGTMILRGFGGKIRTGEITIAEVIAKRNATFPILEFAAGRMSIEEAIKHT